MLKTVEEYNIINTYMRIASRAGQFLIRKGKIIILKNYFLFDSLNKTCVNIIVVNIIVL